MRGENKASFCWHCSLAVGFKSLRDVCRDGFWYLMVWWGGMLSVPVCCGWVCRDVVELCLAMCALAGFDVRRWALVGDCYDIVDHGCLTSIVSGLVVGLCGPWAVLALGGMC